MPEQTCYYVDLANVMYLSNYACLKLTVLMAQLCGKGTISLC